MESEWLTFLKFINPGWAAFLGSLVGAFSVTLSTLLAGWLKQRAEKEKHLRQLAIEIALAEHKMRLDIAFKKEGKAILSPPLAFIPPAYASVKLFMDGKLRADEIEQKYEEVSKISKENGRGVLTHLRPR